MYTVMIVDDERIVHQGLKACLDWKALECEVLYDAFDGIEALELLEREQPDIIITDIKMPGMDGVALSKHLLEQYPDIQVIMLTGFADIEYARQAMEYNVTSYILKPTDTEDIQKAIHKAVHQIRQEEQRKQELRDLEERLEHNRNIARKKLLRDILYGVIKDEDRILREAQRVNLHLESYMLFVMQVEERTDTDRNAPELFLKETEADQIFLVETILNNAFQEQLQYMVFLDKFTLAGLIRTLRLPVEPDVSLSNLTNTIDFIHRSLNIRVFVGVSTIQQGAATVWQAYDEARHALKQRFFEAGMQSLFVYKQPSAFQEDVHPEHPAVKDYLDDLFSCLQSHDDNGINKTLEIFFQEHKQHNIAIDRLKNNCISLCSLCTNYVFTHSSAPEQKTRPHFSIYQHILESRTFSELQRLVLEHFTSLAQHVDAQQQDTHYIIRKARNFIQNNYQEPISLQTIAEAIFVNASYLSRLFRRETGHTITEEIVKAKMEKAKELLRDIDRRIKGIALEVGYEDASYFSRSFKEYTGLSPNAYRRTHRQNRE